MPSKAAKRSSTSAFPLPRRLSGRCPKATGGARFLLRGPARELVDGDLDGSWMSAAALLEAGRAPVTQARPPARKRRCEPRPVGRRDLRFSGAPATPPSRGNSRCSDLRPTAGSVLRASADVPGCEERRPATWSGEPPVLERIDEEAPVQRSSSPAPTVVQRRGDPAKIPGGLVCPPDSSSAERCRPARPSCSPSPGPRSRPPTPCC